MLDGNWKAISLVSAVQVLSEGVFFAQGILQASDETNFKSSEQNELDWIQICVPLFYAAVRQMSEPCWRWIFKGYGDRRTTALGAATIAVSVVAASYQELIVGNAAYIILGGMGMGLVRLQVKLMKSRSGETERSFWGAGTSGIGLLLWPLTTCFFIRSLGHGYAMLILAAIALHAIPLVMLIKPIEEYRPRKLDDVATAQSETVLMPEMNSNNLEEDRLTYQLIEYYSYRVRPSYYVEVLPGIPEEVEHESDHERDHEMQRSIPEVVKTDGIQRGEFGERKSSVQKKKRRRKRPFETLEIETGEKAALKGQEIKEKPFAYTLFVSTILLRLGDQLGVTIVISFLPIFADCLTSNLRIQEKAFLVSLCGFSKIVAEFPLLLLYRRSKKTKVVFLGGPIFAAVSLYFTWNSTSLDAMTLASFGLGIGSGAAAAALQILSPRESPGVSDTADIIVGVSLLGIVPLMRILILGHAIQGCLLPAAGIYAIAAITLVCSIRKAA